MYTAGLVVAQCYN